MSKIAVFLGAGASKAFGYPLTSEILPEMLRRIAAGKLFGATGEQAEKDRQFLGQFLQELLPGLDRTKPEDLPLITEVLSQVDYSLAEGIAIHPYRDIEGMQHLRRLLERAIYESIAKQAASIPEAMKKNLEQFSAWLYAQSVEHEVSILSSNYDVATDTSLFRKFDECNRQSGERIPFENFFDFGFAWRPVEEEDRVCLRPPSPKFRIYKLHGSLNWLRCPLCEHIYVNSYGEIAELAFSRQRHWGNSCHCGYSPLQMHIVTPSLVRQINDPNLRELWKSSLEALRQADTWIMIGYSFPAEDLAIRSLFTRAWHGRPVVDGQTRNPRIQVVQRGDSSRSRYELYFADSRNPDRFYYEAGGLEAFLASVQKLRG